MLLKKLNFSCLVLGALLMSIGCGGGGPEVVPVKGIVTFKGKPIGKINVMFVPSDLKGQIAEGTTNAEGKFELQTLEPGDGATVGNYKVAFKYVSDTIPDMPGFAGGVQPEKSPIPLKYSDETKSGITATVDANASKNDFKFDLN
ncbi:MAG: hypothetical protein KGQ60_02670 [Planctomycetes bacterium]|nr:hypothetical protein [Planctomycetota bacterium]